MIQNVKTRTLMFLVALCAFAGSIVAGSSTPATLTIIDNTANSGTLHSDMLGTYYDHTLSGANPCVTAIAYSTGLFFIYMDYNPAYAPPGSCDSTLGIEGKQEDRTYSLSFPNNESDICTALGLGTAPCTLSLEDNNIARIRADNLFTKNASSTTVSFLFNQTVNNVVTGYTLKTDSSATISSGGGTSRTVTYIGTVSLMTVAGRNSKQVGTSFPCSFEFTVTD